ncbi:Rgp1-domain-containing protein [Exidia glandulosa HHB12029]|uniref:Rgp1-domain-containing protein n=1 Tax=Exidia glandulosa HHB12029 TaxID=1314781 RepID=A0A166BFW8_EXIGL|nr:Rgp1-domain-containing protein [Exidia glandulosa HHB12029]
MSGIRVSVSPSQAAYFAGEPFSFTITFHNTAQPDAPQAPQRASSFSPGHHRAAHSISSAPLAKPPTSPGTPKTAYPAYNHSQGFPGNGSDPLRKGLVGQRHEGPRSAVEPAKQRAASKSLSVSVSPQDLLNRLATDPKIVTNGKVLPSPSSPRVSSPLRRDPLLPSSHPHARKHSLPNITSPALQSASSALAHQVPQTATASAFPLTLDPIREFLRSPLTPGLSSPTPSPVPPSAVNGRTPSDFPLKRTLAPPPPAPSETASPDVLLPAFKFGRSSSTTPQRVNGLGLPPPVTENGSALTTKRARATSSAFRPPGTELLLWAYAQLSGTFELDDQIVRKEAFAALQNELRQAPVVGGGRMEIGALPPTRAANGFFSSFFSTPATPTTSQVAPEDEKQLPTLESRQTMLVVDLSLAPGESKSYRYNSVIPPVLPPTFRGRAFRFSYTLVIGTCRVSSVPSEAKKQYSRVMKIPIRLYNNVTVGRTPSPYDLLWPVARRREKPAECVVEEVRGKLPVQLPRQSPVGKFKDSAAALEDFARQLLSVRDRHLAGLDVGLPGLGEDVAVGCKEAVEVVTRNPKKLSYDVTKDGRKVAVLTFVKSAYRLGETILGMLEFNQLGSGTRVLQLSVMLEAHETLPSNWLERADGAPAPGMRRVHAEHHEALVPCAARAAFALNIPSDAAPEFSLCTGRGAAGGVAWKIRICLLVAAGEGAHLVKDTVASSAWAASWIARASITPVAESSSKEMHTPLTPSWTTFLGSPFARTPEVGLGVSDVRLETVEAEVPVRVWPGNTAFKAADVVFDV